jgi:predicted PhzF superfamily epimerase YddE/YHI9
MAAVARETNLSDTGFVIREDLSDADFRRGDGQLAMDFPAAPPIPVEEPAGLVVALGAPVAWTGLGGDLFLLALLADEQAVRGLSPDIAALKELPNDVVVPTAPADKGNAYDFVSRVFAPKLGLDEDPVTGSAHTVLAPYWAERLGENQLTGLQASARPGIVGVEVRDRRIIVSGHAVTILDGILKPSPT